MSPTEFCCLLIKEFQEVRPSDFTSTVIPVQERLPSSPLKNGESRRPPKSTGEPKTDVIKVRDDNRSIPETEEEGQKREEETRRIFREHNLNPGWTY